MSDRARLEKALIAADKAGDVEAAKKLAAALRSAPVDQPRQEPANRATVAAAPSQEQRAPTGDALDAVLEPIMAIGSSALSMPAAGLAGVGTMATNAVGLTDTDPASVIERVQGWSYQPRTQAGQAAAGAISYPFEKLAQGADWVGDQVAKQSDAPGDLYDVGAAAINTGIQALPAVLTRRGGRASRPATVDRGPSSVTPMDRPVATGAVEQAPKASVPPERPPSPARLSKESVPTRAELAEAAQAAYKKADEAGVVVNENSFKGLKTRVVSMAKKEGIDKDLHPDASAALNKIVKSKGQLTLTELETLRKVAKDAQGSLKPADKRLAGKLVDELDDYIDNLSDADVVAGDAAKVKALKEARGYYARAKKSEVIGELMQRAEDSSKQFSGSGLENAIRTEFRNLAKNNKRMRMFTKQEQAAIRRVAQGGPVENSFRYLGKFAPTGVVSGVLTGGAGAMLGGPAGAALPLVGLAGRYGATRLTLRNANKADELMRRGPEQANALARQRAEQKRNALADF